MAVSKSDKVVHHAVTWQVVNYRQASKKGELEKPIFGVLDTKGELGESPTKQHSYALESKKEEKEIYKSGVEPNYPNSLLATKGGELAENNPPDDIPDYPIAP